MEGKGNEIYNLPRWNLNELQIKDTDLPEDANVAKGYGSAFPSMSHLMYSGGLDTEFPTYPPNNTGNILSINVDSSNPNVRNPISSYNIPPLSYIYWNETNLFPLLPADISQNMSDKTTTNDEVSITPNNTTISQENPNKPNLTNDYRDDRVKKVLPELLYESEFFDFPYVPRDRYDYLFTNSDGIRLIDSKFFSNRSVKNVKQAKQCSDSAIDPFQTIPNEDLATSISKLEINDENHEPKHNFDVNK